MYWVMTNLINNKEIQIKTIRLAKINKFESIE